MAATIINSSRAVEMSVYVVRAFVKLRELLAACPPKVPAFAGIRGLPQASAWVSRISAPFSR